MDGLDVLAGYRKKMESDDVNDRYAALGFSLQLPGICGRIEFPPKDGENVEGNGVENGKVLYKKDSKSDSGYRVLDKNMFCFWITERKSLFHSIFGPYATVWEVAESLYDLRNAFTHQGIVKSNCGRIVLVDAKGVSGMETGGFLFLPLYEFCDMMFCAAEIVFENSRRQHPELIEFLPFSRCGIDEALYCSLKQFAKQKFRVFWDVHSTEDRILSMFCDLVHFRTSGLRTIMEKHFKEHSDESYIIEQFDRKYSIVIPDDIIFFEKEYLVYPDWDAGGVYFGIQCRIDKRQFERMSVVVSELGECIEPIAKQMAKALSIGRLDF